MAEEFKQYGDGLGKNGRNSSVVIVGVLLCLLTFCALYFCVSSNLNSGKGKDAQLGVTHESGTSGTDHQSNLLDESEFSESASGSSSPTELGATN